MSIWSDEIDTILKVGRPLHALGITNWALNKQEAINAIDLLLERGVPILGGDVYDLCEDSIESNYDSWYCNQHENEPDVEYVKRAATVAHKYVISYKNSERSVLFALVPKV